MSRAGSRTVAPSGPAIETLVQWTASAEVHNSFGADPSKVRLPKTRRRLPSPAKLPLGLPTPSPVDCTPSGSNGVRLALPGASVAGRPELGGTGRDPRVGGLGEEAARTGEQLVEGEPRAARDRRRRPVLAVRATTRQAAWSWAHHRSDRRLPRPRNRRRTPRPRWPRLRPARAGSPWSSSSSPLSRTTVEVVPAEPDPVVVTATAAVPVDANWSGAPGRVDLGPGGPVARRPDGVVAGRVLGRDDQAAAAG